jgi:hypothetical protein
MGSLGSLKGATVVDPKADVVPVGFDEGVLRGLCDMDVGRLLLFPGVGRIVPRTVTDGI